MDAEIPRGYCQCGCGQKTKIATYTRRIAGTVEGQPLRYAFGHSSRRVTVRWREEDRGYETPCRVWLVTFNNYGYAIDCVDGKEGAAHRFAYEREIGPIPEGYALHHLCGIRACVNPYHLQPVTPTEHRQLHAKKLTHQDVVAIRRSDEHSRDLAAEYDVTENHIIEIRAGRRWIGVAA